MKAIQSAITQAGPTPLDTPNVIASPTNEHRQGISLSEIDIENLDLLKARVSSTVSVEDLLRAGLLGLLEFDDDELRGLIEEVRAAAVSS